MLFAVNDWVSVFQSTLPARGATTCATERWSGQKISIHAPRTGSDLRAHIFQVLRVHISIHAPRTGSDSTPTIVCSGATHFNPRSPHGERRLWRNGGRRRGDFNPRSPHGERPGFGLDDVRQRAISIHAPRTGSDPQTFDVLSSYELFQSTLPARGATQIAAILGNMCRISIHAPRTGSDADAFPRRPHHVNFNPRSPHGERL